MNQPKEIGLLFTPENRALWRQNLKLQTRRGMKDSDFLSLDGAISAEWHNGFWSFFNAQGYDVGSRKSPYGNPQANPVVYYPKEPVRIVSLWDAVTSNTEHGLASIQYIDDSPDDIVECDVHKVLLAPGDYHKLLARQDWRKPSSPMFMLKSFARDKRRGLRVWPERLGDMSAEDAIAEGIKALSKDGGQTIKYGLPDADGLPGAMPWQDWQLNPVDAYRKVWESINGPNSWQPDKWVWCIKWGAAS